jgi:hypothetical protein
MCRTGTKIGTVQIDNLISSHQHAPTHTHTHTHIYITNNQVLIISLENWNWSVLTKVARTAQHTFEPLQKWNAKQVPDTILHQMWIHNNLTPSLQHNKLFWENRLWTSLPISCGDRKTHVHVTKEGGPNQLQVTVCNERD